MLIHEIEPRYLLAEPPDLTRDIAAARWREINILLHGIALLSDDLEDRKSLLPLLRASVSIVDAEAGILYQWDESRSGLSLTTFLGFTGDPPEVLMTRNLQAHACLLQRKPVLLSSPSEEHFREEMSFLGARAALSIPITHQGMPWGAIQLLRDRPFEKDEGVLLWIFALILEGVLPALLGVRRHREMVAAIDPVTGLLTPTHFRRRLAWELQRSAWVARPVTVACVEVTEMLHGRPRSGGIPFTPRDAAYSAQKALRQHDSLTCLGGHRYIALMPDTEKAEAQRIVDLIRDGFLARAAGTLPVMDVASGLATFPGDGHSEEEMIRAARNAARRPGAEASRSPRGG